ncbi:MAG: sigma-54 dependent transcriptional regulator [Myxococcota bacterium]|nr:sigma-54 dependent transcriptional regulator [Myxococcota bacterium]
MTTRILVIEDDLGIRSNILDLLDAEGFEAVGAPDGGAGVAEALARPPDLVLCDVTMPALDGYGVLRALSEHDSTATIPFVFLTAKADRGDVRLGMNLGADDYITKPFTRADLLDTIRARLERNRLRASRVPDEPGSGKHVRPRPERATTMIVLDPVMRAVYDEARRAARGPISILILGETGVGKEILAHEIHRSSTRASGPFVALNCAALSDTLLESELFGHEKSAFTGAAQSKPGLLESANGGTVFLDEIGDIPLSTQVKLLRVLEDRKVMRVGGRAALPIDVRFVAATNRDIERDADQGIFRRDLLFRLNSVTLTLPPLRERHGELEALAQVFLRATSEELGRTTPRIMPAAMSALLAHDWPGNVRELRNVMERAALMCSSAELGPEHLPPKIGGAHRVTPPPAAPSCSAGGHPSGASARSDRDHAPADFLEERRGALAEVERRRIEDALARCAGNQTQAAALLGISRRTLVSRLSQYELPRPRKR